MLPYLRVIFLSISFFLLCFFLFLFFFFPFSLLRVLLLLLLFPILFLLFLFLFSFLFCCRNLTPHPRPAQKFFKKKEKKREKKKKKKKKKKREKKNINMETPELGEVLQGARAFLEEATAREGPLTKPEQFLRQGMKIREAVEAIKEHCREDRTSVGECADWIRAECVPAELQRALRAESKGGDGALFAEFWRHACNGRGAIRDRSSKPWRRSAQQHD